MHPYEAIGDANLRAEEFKARAERAEAKLSEAKTNTCAECRFWERSPYDEARGECTLTRWGDMNGHEHPESKAKAQAGGHEPDSAALETSADFGCVQFKAVERKQQTSYTFVTTDGEKQ